MCSKPRRFSPVSGACVGTAAPGVSYAADSSANRAGLAQRHARFRPSAQVSEVVADRERVAFEIVGQGTRRAQVRFQSGEARQRREAGSLLDTSAEQAQPQPGPA